MSLELTDTHYYIRNRKTIQTYCIAQGKDIGTLSNEEEHSKSETGRDAHLERSAGVLNEKHRKEGT